MGGDETKLAEETVIEDDITTSGASPPTSPLAAEAASPSKHMTPPARRAPPPPPDASPVLSSSLSASAHTCAVARVVLAPGATKPAVTAGERKDKAVAQPATASDCVGAHPATPSEKAAKCLRDGPVLFRGSWLFPIADTIGTSWRLG